MNTSYPLLEALYKQGPNELIPALFNTLLVATGGRTAFLVEKSNFGSHENEYNLFMDFLNKSSILQTKKDPRSIKGYPRTLVYRFDTYPVPAMDNDEELGLSLGFQPMCTKAFLENRTNNTISYDVLFTYHNTKQWFTFFTEMCNSSHKTPDKTDNYKQIIEDNELGELGFTDVRRQVTNLGNLSVGAFFDDNINRENELAKTKAFYAQLINFFKQFIPNVDVQPIVSFLEQNHKKNGSELHPAPGHRLRTHIDSIWYTPEFFFFFYTF